MSELNDACYFMCPYCGETISMSFERFSGSQEYIEDCEVCCRPICVSYEVNDGEVVLNQVKRLDE
ncbi:MAG: CPXCG motif-containing cysteine-rich protein [Halobacteriovoraceae bacterium]|nr:CPXCG motif-containing cysteine-rich protein [Halobacteriovoraceae bacterium]